MGKRKHRHPTHTYLSDNLRTSYTRLSDKIWTPYTYFSDNKHENFEVKVKKKGENKVFHKFPCAHRDPLYNIYNVKISVHLIVP